ncbi:hypothetical protein, partial [Streptomyces sp. NPDC001876]|uniref:hypothetical protein n=1 Tax=Streptomyces sp. NPDC001876 TaxID=3154402 RepID=UPI003333A747
GYCAAASLREIERMPRLLRASGRRMKPGQEESALPVRPFVLLSRREWEVLHRAAGNGGVESAR